MKWFFVAVFVFCVTINLSQALTEEQKKKELEHAKACMKEVGLSPESLKKMQSGDFSNPDANTKCFAKCVLLKHGFVNNMGELQEQRTIDELSRDNDKAKVTSAVAKCKLTKSSDPCERAFEYYSCYKKETK